MIASKVKVHGFSIKQQESQKNFSGPGYLSLYVLKMETFLHLPEAQKKLW